MYLIDFLDFNASEIRFCFHCMHARKFLKNCIQLMSVRNIFLKYAFRLLWVFRELSMK